MSHNHFSMKDNLHRDIPASIVVFLVAVPLCLGIALASGAPMISGLISGIIGGIVVGAISQSPLGVSGPAAGLAVIVLAAINQLGDFNVFLAAVVLAGVFQIALGLLKAGFIGYFFPSSVIKGMLTGIGLIILLKQIPHALGYDEVYEGSLEFLQADGQNTFSELIHVLSMISPGALIISLVSLGLLIAWEQPWIGRRSWTKLIPGPLVAVTVGSLMALGFQSVSGFKLQADQLVTVPVISGLGEAASLLTFPDFSALLSPDVVAVALTIAVVASIESLLCVEAADKLDPHKRVTPTNRELVAQGVGNAVAGLIGGLPVTQVIVRSSSNAQAGARTKVSAIFHGVWLLVSLLFVPTLLNGIPLASLAAILIVVGYKLAKPQVFVQLYREGAEQFIPFLVTVVGLLFTDLLMGVALGMAVALVTILWENYRNPYYADPDLDHPENGVRIQLAEDVSFLNKAGLLRTLDHLPDDLHVVLDASKTRKMHPDIREIIENFRINAKTRNIKAEYIPMANGEPIDHMTHVRVRVANTSKTSGAKS